MSLGLRVILLVASVMTCAYFAQAEEVTDTDYGYGILDWPVSSFCLACGFSSNCRIFV